VLGITLARLHGSGSGGDHQRTEPHMLWTILVILAIVALVLFILGRVRGGRRSGL
jgi:hypothetical protein